MAAGKDTGGVQEQHLLAHPVGRVVLVDGPVLAQVEDWSHPEADLRQVSAAQPGREQVGGDRPELLDVGDAGARPRR
jgi:hypothetical protein